MIKKVKLVIAGNEDCVYEKSRVVSYTCSYELGGKIRMINSSGVYCELRSYEKDLQTPLVLSFTKTKMSFDYEYNADEKTQSDIDKDIQKIVELFWKNHPMTLINGASHSNIKTAPEFNLIDFNIKTINSNNILKDTLKVANAISNMTHEQRVNVAYYYGLSPADKSEEEVIEVLSDLNSGYCVKPENLESFIKTFIEGKTMDTHDIVVIKKAIDYKIITKKEIGGIANYYLKDTLVGTNDTTILSWVRKNDVDYKNHIEREVIRLDEEKKAKDMIKDSTVDLNELETLRKEVSKLKEQGLVDKWRDVSKMSYDKLKDMVTEAKNKVLAK